MRTYHTTRRVGHSAENMFSLVAKVEDYPDFVPLCNQLTVQRREVAGQYEVLIADMSVAYKFIRESFSSRVTLDYYGQEILVEYLDGPFSHMENRWWFHPVDDDNCDVEFRIAYEFRSRALQLLMGSMFDKAFRKFAEAFEARADKVYGRFPAARAADPASP